MLALAALSGCTEPLPVPVSKPTVEWPRQLKQQKQPEREIKKGLEAAQQLLEEGREKAVKREEEKRKR